MNLLFSCIGKRGYIADFFRPQLDPEDRIIGTGNTPWTPGFRACDAAFVLPDIGDDAYLPAVLELCEREQVDAVLSFLDPDVHVLAQAHAELRARGVLPLVPSAEIAEVAFDKYRTYEFLEHRGISTPQTALDLAGAADFHFPVYVKPRRGSGGHMTFLARDAAELSVFFGYRPDMIIQERVVGEEINIELCTDLEGRPVGISTWRKYQSRLGETEQAETFRDPLVLDFGLHLGRVLGATGPMDVDVLRQGDTLVVLEANTRFGGGYPVSHLAGADFPRLLIELVKHGHVAPHLSFAAGIVMMKGLEVIGGPSHLFFRNELGVV